MTRGVWRLGAGTRHPLRHTPPPPSAEHSTQAATLQGPHGTCGTAILAQAPLPRCMRRHARCGNRSNTVRDPVSTQRQRKDYLGLYTGLACTPSWFQGLECALHTVDMLFGTAAAAFLRCTEICDPAAVVIVASSHCKVTARPAGGFSTLIQSNPPRAAGNTNSFPRFNVWWPARTIFDPPRFNIVRVPARIPV